MSFFGCGVLGSSKQQLDCRVYNKLRTEVRGHAGRQKKRGDAPLLTTNYAQSSVDTQVGRRNEETHRFLQQTTHRGPWTRRSAEETVSLNRRSLDVAMPRHTNVLLRLAASRERMVNTDWIAFLTGQLYITLILGSAPRGAQLSRFTALLASLVA